MNTFFERIVQLVVDQLTVTNEARKALLKAFAEATARLQLAALKFDGFVAAGASAALGEGLIDLAGLFATAFPQLNEDQKAAVKAAINKTVDLPEGNDAAELAAEDFFSALVDTLAAEQALVADENATVQL